MVESAPAATAPATDLAGASSRARLLYTVAAGLVTLRMSLVLAAAGWCLLFSTFMSYDDEGYVLVTLRHFAAGSPLYDRLYTQYGPFFYLLADTLRGLLRFEWNSTSARLLALVCWFGSAAGCAALVARQTKSFACSAFTFVATFAYLYCTVYEPSHPGSLIALFVVIAALVGSGGALHERPAAAAAVGALGAALVFTKINVGGFLLIAASAWLLLNAAWLGARRAAFVALCLALALAALPWLLTRQLLLDGTVLQFAAITSLAMLGTLAAARTGARPVAGPRVLVAFALGAAGVALISVGAIVARGTSLLGLLHGVLLDPIRHPLINLIRVYWLQDAWSWAGVAVAVTAWAYAKPNSTAAASALAVVRALAAITLARVAMTAPSELALFGMSYGVSIAGLCALPMRRDAAGMSDARARQWLALLLVLQSLHAFPTAGSQVAWGTFLIVPLVSLAVRDAWLALLPDSGPAPALRGGASRWHALRPWSAVAPLAAIVLSVVISEHMLVGALRQYRQGEPLELHGAEQISLPSPTVLTLRTLVENARAHAGVLFSGGGMYSFNLWAERPTPTLANVTFWAALLKPEAQREIIARLGADPRAVLIRKAGFRADGELYAYLEHEFRPAFALNGYVFLVHRGRRIAPLSTAQLRQATPDSVELDLTLARVAQPIARIDIRQLGAPAETALRLSAENATLESTPLAHDGRSAGAARPLAWPAELHDSITSLRVRFAGHVPPTGTWVADVFSRTGRVGAAPILR